MTTRRRFFAWTAGLAAAVPALAQHGRWDYLGEANVDGTNDHDRIRVGKGYGRFRGIRLHVENGPILFHHVVVEFGDGEKGEIKIAAEIPAGGQTRALPLQGKDQHIEAVEIWYGRVLANGPKPRVRLFGLH